MPRFEPLGIGDLVVLKKKLTRYEAGEIAHVENVMGKEYRDRVHRQLREVQTRELEEIEREEERRRDLETTERFEVENEIKREIQTQEKFSAGLEVSGGLGPVRISAYAKYDRASSEEESERAAQKYAKEITEKAMERIKERVRTERETIERTETEETNEHHFKNDAAEHIVGVYRWVDKYYRVKPINYGKRLFYEVVVPEPAALRLFSRIASSAEGTLPERPAPPKVPMFEFLGVEYWFDGETLQTEDPGPLRPDQLHEWNYAWLASEYGADGVRPPPAAEITVSHSINREFDPALDFILDGESIAIPEDYEAITCHLKILAKSWAVHAAPGTGGFETIWPYPAGYPGYCRLQVGLNALNQFTQFGLLGPPWGDETYTYYLDAERGQVPISGTGNRIGTLAVNAEIECRRTEEAMAQWQLATYRAIAAGYAKRVFEYEEKLRASSVAGGVSISGDNPERNLLVIKEELKRQFLRLWMGSDLDLPAGIADGDASETPPILPEAIPANVLANSETISFAEEAFDWDNLSFRLLPYFHGRKEKWLELSGYTDPDPVFENFLKAGAAIVRIPVVPEYTHAVLFYQLTGRIWSRHAGEVPALADVSADPRVELYNGFLADVDPEESVTDIHGTVEIRDDDPTTFEIKVPTSLVWLQPGAALNPEA